ncbi:hypothetical protein Taro_041098 [Colocasia esculenta]|uniref:Uncharacterized protein n=1 Tax=Colocasia esculenta TaxID=4460 RepID=A0A843WUW1_COLES|nr:hypothetical protein [Colocasia esculenta]
MHFLDSHFEDCNGHGARVPGSHQGSDCRHRRCNDPESALPLGSTNTGVARLAWNGSRRRPT